VVDDSLQKSLDGLDGFLLADPPIPINHFNQSDHDDHDDDSDSIKTEGIISTRLTLLHAVHTRLY